MLPLLGPPDVERYLAMQFPGHAFPPNFAELIYSRTEGNPLFMADLLRYLRERGIIAETNGKWSLNQELPTLWQELPASVRSMIERKLERLDEDDWRLWPWLRAGAAIDSAVVAAAAGRDAAMSKSHCSAGPRAWLVPVAGGRVRQPHADAPLPVRPRALSAGARHRSAPDAPRRDQPGVGRGLAHASGRAGRLVRGGVGVPL
jgi:hypothetical protein